MGGAEQDEESSGPAGKETEKQSDEGNRRDEGRLDDLHGKGSLAMDMVAGSQTSMRWLIDRHLRLCDAVGDLRLPTSRATDYRRPLLRRCRGLVGAVTSARS